MQIAVSGLKTLRRVGRKAGPYIMLEMLLPGGTLFALLFFLYRRRECGIGWAPSRRPAAAMRTLGGGLDKPTQASIPTLEPQRSTKFRSES